MIQDVRIYKKFDIDLIALCAAGFPVTEMIRTAVTAFANGESVKFDIGPAQFFDLNDKHSVRMRISITDKNAVRVLKNIKHGHRNSFCKNVLRSAVSNLAAYFADSSMLSLCQSSAPTVMKASPEFTTLQPFKNMTVPAQIVPEVSQPISTLPPVVPAPQPTPAPIPVSEPERMDTAPVFTPFVKAPAEQVVLDNASSEEDEDSILDMFDGL